MEAGVMWEAEVMPRKGASELVWSFVCSLGRASGYNVGFHRGGGLWL